MLRPDYPLGVCQAGCSTLTDIAPKTDREMGWVAGKPKIFCSSTCAQSMSKALGVSRLSRSYAQWFDRQAELERDALEVRAILAEIQQVEAEGRLADAECWRCEAPWVAVEETSRGLRLRCLNCRKQLSKSVLRSPLELAA